MTSSAQEAERRVIRSDAEHTAARLPAAPLFGNTNHYNDKNFARGVNKSGLLPYYLSEDPALTAHPHNSAQGAARLASAKHSEDGRGGVQGEGPRFKIYFYLMKPSPSGTHETDPQFQICKGTRAKRKNGDWVDYRPNVKEKVAPEDLEDFYINALREGIEEIGLRTANLNAVYEWGRTEFLSESRHTPITMWLYLANLKDPQDFGTPSEYDAKTGACAWLTLPEDAAKIRPDHLKILEKVTGYFQQDNNILVQLTR